MTPEQELTRAAHATALQENPLLNEALAAYELEITEQWKKSPLRDVEGREKLRLMLEAARSFQAYLQSTVEAGKLVKVKTSEPLPLRVAKWAGMR